jgi:hypothetical protein
MRLLFGVLALAAVGGSLSQASAREPAAEAAERLVLQLGSKKYAAREAAARKLEALGEAALAPLKRAVRNSDLETSRRAEELILRIQHQLETARLLAPTRLRLAHKAVPLAAAVRDLARRTGFDIRLDGEDPPAKRTVTLETGELPFWDALDRLCRAASLSEEAGLDGSGAGTGVAGQVCGFPLLLADRRSKPLPSCVTGSVRLRALPVGAGLQGWRVFQRPGDDDGKPATGFMLEAVGEPKLPWLGIVRLRVHRAVDEHEQDLSQPAALLGAPQPPDLDVERPLVWDGMSGVPVAALPLRTVPVRLVAGKKASSRLKEVRGTLTARVLATGPLLTVENVLRAEGKTFHGKGGPMLKVTRVARDGTRLTLHVQAQPRTADGGGGTPFQVVRDPKGRLLMQGSGVGAASDLDLLDAAGTVLKPLKRERTLTPNPQPRAGGLLLEFTLVYALAPGAPEPSRLVWTGPRATLLDVPFTLRQVPVSPAALPTRQPPLRNPYMPGG